MTEENVIKSDCGTAIYRSFLIPASASLKVMAPIDEVDLAADRDTVSEDQQNFIPITARREGSVLKTQYLSRLGD